MQDKRDMTIKELAKDCRTIEDVHEMLKNLFRDTIHQLFEAEMDDHLGYAKHSADGDHTGNSRNEYSKKFASPYALDSIGSEKDVPIRGMKPVHISVD
ncbi:transposase [Brevibacillus borstelensis]|uniref:transposase n=1 Tax=Brevibacillus borstelensis TaxID=45462 RepID=UPI003CC91FF5